MMASAISSDAATQDENDDARARAQVDEQEVLPPRLMLERQCSREMAHDYPFNEDKESEIGRGASAIVYRGTEIRSGRGIAVKVFPFVTNERRRNMEVAVCEKNRVENLGINGVVRFISTREQTSTGCHAIVMELLNGGSLKDRLVHQGKQTEEETKRVIGKLAQTLVHLHGAGIVHRDIKIEDVLFSNDEFEKGRVCLIDFGLASLDGNSSHDGVVGTLGNIPPEVLERFHHSEKGDIWSLGVVAYTMLVGFPPFSATDALLKEKTIRGQIFPLSSKQWSDVSCEAKDLISHMLDVNVETRYSASTVLTHPFITGAELRERGGGAFIPAITASSVAASSSSPLSLKPLPSPPRKAHSRARTHTRRQFTAFLSHDWGKEDKENKAKSHLNHQKVVLINEALVARGMSCWLDTGKSGLSGGNDIAKLCAEGIDASYIFVAFITPTYNKKLSKDIRLNDACQLEFNYAWTKNLDMLACVIDEASVDHSSWTDPKLLMKLGSALHVEVLSFPGGEEAVGAGAAGGSEKEREREERKKEAFEKEIDKLFEAISKLADAVRKREEKREEEEWEAQEREEEEERRRKVECEDENKNVSRVVAAQEERKEKETPKERRPEREKRNCVVM